MGTWHKIDKRTLSVVSPPFGLDRTNGAKSNTKTYETSRSIFAVRDGDQFFGFSYVDDGASRTHDMETELKTHILSDSRPTRVPKTSGDLHLSVGRYELVRRLAYGGMAAVYLGRVLGKAGFEKTVAVKVIHPHLAAEEQFVQMFLDEARIVAGIQHPHVVQILDLGQDGELYYMVMEFVEGETLSALISSLAPDRLPLAVTIQIIADAVSGLAAAHALKTPDGDSYKIVHRDISPQNLLINLLGWVKVSDFGIMKVAGADRNTRAGELRGKLAYMSPEQARGLEIDHRTDLFSLGVILWELLVGRRLFMGENEAATLENVLSCKVPELGSVMWPPLVDQSQEFRERLQHILDRTLARDPSDRYANAPEMLGDLQVLLRMCVQEQSDDEPREQLAWFMKQHFAARAAYARAALREATPVDSVGEVNSESTECFKSKFDRQAGRSDLWAIPPIESSSDSKLSTIADLRAKSSSSSRTNGLWANGWLRSIFASAVIATLGATLVVFVFGLQEDSDVYFSGELASSVKSSLSNRTSSEIQVPTIASMLVARKYDNENDEDINSDNNSQLTLSSDDLPETVRWEFSGSPLGASVLIDGRLHSKETPTRIEVNHDEHILHHVVIFKEGMRSIEYRLYPLTDQNIVYQLFPVDHNPSSGRARVDSNSRSASAKASEKSATIANEGPKFMPMPKFEPGNSKSRK